jgi:biofilm PGA synthesis protein PgaD
MNPPIIDRSDLQSLKDRTIGGVLTLVFWVFWGYLWLPVLAMLAWALGVQQAYKYMVVLGGWQEVLRLLGLYTLVILLLGGSLCSWAAYNILRYGPFERRVGNRVPSMEEIARSFHHGPLAVESWRAAQRLYVTHDAKGGIAQVDILAPGAPLPSTPDA